jgi:predicted lipoprotein
MSPNSTFCDGDHSSKETMAVASILEGVGQGALMPTYDDLIELAEICLKQARAAKSRAVAAELRRMAKEYQKRAAEPDQAAAQQAPQISQAAYRHPPPAGREKRAAK